MNFIDREHNTVSSIDCLLKSGLCDSLTVIPAVLPSIIDDIESLCEFDHNQRCAYILHRFFDCFTFDELVEIVSSVAEKIDIGSPLLCLDDGYMLVELFSERTLSYHGFTVGMIPKLIARARAKAGLGKKYLIVSAEADYVQSAIKTDPHVVSLLSCDSSPIIKAYLNSTNGNIFELSSTKNVLTKAVDDIANDLDIDIYKLEDMSILKMVIGGCLIVSSYCELLNMGEVEVDTKFNVILDSKSFDLALSAMLVERMGLPIDAVVISDDENQRVHQIFYDQEHDIRISNDSPLNFQKGEAELLLRLIYANDNAIVLKAIDELNKQGYYSISHDEFSHMMGCLITGYCTDYDEEYMAETVNSEDDYIVSRSTARVMSIYDDYTDAFNDNTTALMFSIESPLVDPCFAMTQIPDRRANTQKDMLRVIAEEMGYDILDIIDRKQSVKWITIDELKTTLNEVINGIKGE